MLTYQRPANKTHQSLEFMTHGFRTPTPCSLVAPAPTRAPPRASPYRPAWGVESQVRSGVGLGHGDGEWTCLARFAAQDGAELGGLARAETGETGKPV